MDNTAALAWATHIACWSWGMCFSAALSSEKDQGSMNLASNTAPVCWTRPSRVAPIQRNTQRAGTLSTSVHVRGNAISEGHEPGGRPQAPGRQRSTPRIATISAAEHLPLMLRSSRTALAFAGRCGKQTRMATQSDLGSLNLHDVERSPERAGTERVRLLTNMGAIV